MELSENSKKLQFIFIYLGRLGEVAVLTSTQQAME
jgi:hypothetical protein